MQWGMGQKAVKTRKWGENNMPSIIIGNTKGLILQPDQSVSQAPDGSGEARLSYKTPWVNVALYIPTPLQPHPLFPSLLLFEFTTNREVGDIAKFDCIYRGVLAANPMDLAQYEGTKATTSEPIETHPLFAYPASAPPVSPAELVAINLALQNNTTPTGLGTAATLLYNKKLRGIDSYYRVATTFRKSYVSTSIPSSTNVAKVGHIATSMDPNAPSLPTGANYLYTGLSWRKAAGVVSNVEEYQGSGLGSWDIDLYT